MKTTMKLRDLQTAVLMLLLTRTGSLLANDWKVGDVFVAVGNGQYKVYDNAGQPKETIIDGQSGGVTGGCAFDATYHLYTTNISNTKVVRYKIDHPHGILQTINTASDSVTGGGGSVTFAGNGDFYVGNPGGDGFIRRYNSAGVPQATYPVAVENAGSNWIDIRADGNVIFYTSQGRLIKRYDVLNNQQLSDFANLGNAGGPKYRAFALRLLPPGDGSGGLLVADKRNIKRLNGQAAAVKVYDAQGQDDWRSLNLDPNGTSFWAGDATSRRLYRFNIATGVIEVGPVSTQSGSLSGICVDGNFSAAQASPEPTQSAVVSLSNSTATFGLLNGTNKLTITLNSLTGSVNLTARASVIDPAAGFSDSGMPCTRTADNGNKCVVWSIEATPDTVISSVDFKIFEVVTDMNSRLLRNEATDITTFVKNLDPGGTTRRFSVYSLNQASVTGNATSCGYQTPITDGSVHNLGSTLSFRFQAAGNCSSGPFLTNLMPRLSLVRLVQGEAPHPETVEVSGNSGAPPLYRPQPDGKTYKLNVATKNLPSGDYIATTFDDSGQIPAFEVQFSLR